MHHFESNGYGFNYNGDYSGEIHIEDPNGHTQTREIADLINISVGGVGYDTPHVKAVRDFIADAVQIATISKVEQMSTEELLHEFNEFELLDIIESY